MEKQYLSAPLPFVGQKRMFAKEYMKVLGMVKDAKVFVDLFGGSGLLSHITKRQRPDATVVYNDFDNYRRRIENIPRTNAMIDRLRDILASVPRLKIVPKPCPRHDGGGRGANRLCGLYHTVNITAVLDEVCHDTGGDAQAYHV